MTNLAGIVQQFWTERDQAARVLERLDVAIAALNGGSFGKRTGHRRHLSLAERARIVAAQRARWAKVGRNSGQKTERGQHAQEEDDVNRRSEEDCRSTKARWAKLKAAQQKAAWNPDLAALFRHRRVISSCLLNPKR